MMAVSTSMAWSVPFARAFRSGVGKDVSTSPPLVAGVGGMGPSTPSRLCGSAAICGVCVDPESAPSGAVSCGETERVIVSDTPLSNPATLPLGASAARPELGFANWDVLSGIVCTPVEAAAE